MTTIKFYKSRKALIRGIRKMEKAGYCIINIETMMVRPGCLALMVFPLRIFSKVENFKVHFSKV